MAGDAFFAQWLQAYVVGAGVEVSVHNLGDLVGAALRNHGVEQSVGAAVGEVGFGEAEVEQVLPVVAEIEVAP